MPEDNGSVIFGMSSFRSAVTGVSLTDLDFGDSAQELEHLDEDGLLDQIDIYGYKKTVTGNGTVKTSGSIAVAVGATLTLDSVDYKITSCNKKYLNTGHVAFTFSGVAPGSAPGSGSGSGSTSP